MPDSIDMDVAASCDGSVAIDCPGGTPAPPADQLRITSTRSLVHQAAQHRYDLTATSDVQTLQAIKMSGFGLDCEVTATSASGTYPDWQILVPLQFHLDSWGEVRRIAPGAVTLNRVEEPDLDISGGFLCESFNWGIAFFIDTFVGMTEDLLGDVGDLCVAPGPEYMGPCPEE